MAVNMMLSFRISLSRLVGSPCEKCVLRLTGAIGQLVSGSCQGVTETVFGAPPAGVAFPGYRPAYKDFCEFDTQAPQADALPPDFSCIR